MSVLALPLRAAQLLFAVIILGLMAYVVDNWSIWTWSPDSANFLLFCAVWTILATIYLILASMTFAHHPAGHKFGVLAVEVITTIFWFAGFIALASLLSEVPGHRWGVKRVAVAADVFGAFEWLLFSATLILSALHCWRTRGEYSSKPDPNMQVDSRV